MPDALLQAARLWMTVDDVLRIVDANTTRQEIERALIANLPSNGGAAPPAESSRAQTEIGD